MDDAVIRTREAFSGVLNRLADVDRDTTGLLRQVVDEAMIRPYQKSTPEFEQPTEHMWMLLDTAQGVAARMQEASSSLAGLTGTVQALERSSENLAYAALTVPANPSWSWRSFAWGVAALAVVIAVIAFAQTL
jgi:acetyl-CoA carboxylase beta subunit